MSKIFLQQFARLPRVGAVKTRLQASLSVEEACAVHVELMLTVARSLRTAELGPVELWLDQPGTHPAVDDCLALGLVGPFMQRGHDLGERMEQALIDGLARADRVLLTGSDCPGLDPGYLADAAQALENHDVVFGTAEDGGYVLLGCRRMQPGLLAGVPWGSGEVLAASERCIDRRGWSWRCLPPRYDVDTPADLARWRAECQAGADARP